MNTTEYLKLQKEKYEYRQMTKKNFKTEGDDIMWHRITSFFSEDFNKNYGEGTKYDLDYGKLLIIGLCVYIAIQVS